jgi:hypothetical protein
MCRTASVIYWIVAALWLGLAVILAGAMLVAEIKGRQFPSAIPATAGVATIVGLRFLWVARHLSRARWLSRQK